MLNKNYTVERIWIEGGIITLAQFKLDFTDDTKPGITSLHAGTVPIVGQSESATNQQIVDALEIFLAPSMPQLEAFHQHQIDFQYTKEQSTPVDKNVPPPTSVPVLVCLANLQVSGVDVTGIETAVGFSMAFAIDVGVIWAFFEKPMENLSYTWNVSSSTGLVNVTERTLEYFQISITDNTGAPLDVTELAIQIFKAQRNEG